MINRRFLRIQLKRLWVPILIIGIIVGGFTGMAMGAHYLTPYNELTSAGGRYHNNAMTLNVYYRSILFGFLMSYSFIALIRLLLVEQERGYIASWLVTPMTRWTIFATKYLAMIIGLLIIDFFSILLQLILYGAMMEDFNQYVGYIFLSHLSVVVGVFFLASLMWLIGSCFIRQWVPILIIVILISWCGVASTLGTLGAQSVPPIQWMKGMYNVSLFSLIHSPFERFSEPNHDSNMASWIEWGKILPIRAVDYAWQIPVMTILGVGCFIGSQFILKNKDYNV